MEEKRNYSRERTLWKVNVVEAKLETFIGYLMDLSEGGAKFYIDIKRTDKLANNFDVKIKPPYDTELNDRVLTVEKVWQRETHFLEMGVKFNEKSDEDKEYIRVLLSRFTDDNKMTVETEIMG
jgi:hypothetical protein